MSVRPFPARPSPDPALAGRAAGAAAPGRAGAGRPGRAGHLVLGALQRALHRPAARPARPLALSRARRRRPDRPRGAGAGRARGAAAGAAGGAVADWRCWRTSCATRATHRSRVCRSARAGATWVCCWRPICGRSAMARTSGCMLERGGAAPLAAAGSDGPPMGRHRWRDAARSRVSRRWSTPCAFLAEHAGSPQLYVAELGRALEPLLPHDHLELLVADAERVRAYRLGEHAGGPLWADPSLVIGREHLDLDALFEHRDAVISARHIPGCALAARLLHGRGAGRGGAAVGGRGAGAGTAAASRRICWRAA